MTLFPNPRILTATAFASLALASCAVGPKAPDATLPPSASGAFIGAAVPAVTVEAARDEISKNTALTVDRVERAPRGI